MKLDGVTTVPLSSVEECDAIVYACGYETRSRTLLESAPAAKGFKLCLGFTEQKAAFARPDNERRFREAGVAIRELSGASKVEVRHAIRDALEHVPDGGMLGIDITSMTRIWHAAVVSELLSTVGRRQLRTLFAYIPAAFVQPSDDYSRTKHVCPLEGFTSFGLPNLPTALVVGLGYEPERALGLQALLDPTATAVFIANPADSRYLNTVLEKNQDILRVVPDEGVFEYPIADPAMTLQLLDSLCAGLAADFRVVLASLGPKIFGLQCLLLAAMRPGFSVWRVSSGSAEPSDALPDLSLASACSVRWVADA